MQHKTQHAIMLLSKFSTHAISTEYKSRLIYLYQNLKRLNPDIIIFSGGIAPNGSSPVGKMGREYFLENAPDYGRYKIFCDTNAMKTVDEFQHAFRILGENDALRMGTKITVISSDYHIYRIMKIHELVPTMSLLNMFLEKGAEIRAETPLYPFSRPHFPPNESPIFWSGQIYRIGDWLGVLQAAMEAAMNNANNMDWGQTIKESIDCFARFFNIIDSLPKEMAGYFLARTENACACILEIQTFLNNAKYFGAKAENGNLKAMHDLLMVAIKELRALDPDRNENYIAQKRLPKQ